MTSEDHMRAAFAALLAEDYAERDRRCELARQALRDERLEDLKKFMEIDFVVYPDGTVVPLTAAMARA